MHIGWLYMYLFNSDWIFTLYKKVSVSQVHLSWRGQANLPKSIYAGKNQWSLFCTYCTLNLHTCSQEETEEKSWTKKNQISHVKLKGWDQTCLFSSTYSDGCLYYVNLLRSVKRWMWISCSPKQEYKQSKTSKCMRHFIIMTSVFKKHLAHVTQQPLSTVRYLTDKLLPTFSSNIFTVICLSLWHFMYNPFQMYALLE